MTDFQCSICEKLFTTRLECEKHMKHVHVHKVNKKLKGKRQYECATCQKFFSAKFPLERHMKTFHCPEFPNDVECTICGNMFRDKTNLTRHVKTMHFHLTSDKIFSCAHCEFKATRKYVLLRHIQARHMNTSGTFLCSYCGYSTHNNYNLNKHVQKHLKEKEERILRTNNVIKCPDCRLKIRSMKDLIMHVEIDHSQAMDIRTMTFASESEFDQWVKSEELENACKFARMSKSKKGRILMCNRSGHLRSDVESVMHRKRQQKYRGSCKIGGTCTAYITTKINNENIDVTYCSTHFGHLRDPAHLPFSEEDRNVLATMLLKGIPMDQILRDVRSRNPDEDLRRIHLTTRHDLNNIAAKYNIKPCRKVHHETIDNIGAWVKKERNKILFYKPKGCKYKNVGDDDFILVIQTAFQCTMLQKYGQQVICIDPSYRGKMNVTSIFICDQLKQWFPIAVCISTRVNYETIKLFISKLRIKCGKVECNSLLTSDDYVSKQAWEEAMETHNVNWVKKKIHQVAFHKIFTLNQLSTENSVGKCIADLLRYLNKQMDKRLVQKGHRRNGKVLPRHKSGVMLVEAVKKLSEMKWMIEMDEMYIIQKDKEHVVCHSDADCGVTCTECKICLKSYECSCPDNRLSKNLCEHIHAVHLFENSSETGTGLDSYLKGDMTTTKVICVPEFGQGSLIAATDEEDLTYDDKQVIRIFKCETGGILQDVQEGETQVYQLGIENTVEDLDEEEGDSNLKHKAHTKIENIDEIVVETLEELEEYSDEEQMVADEDPILEILEDLSVMTTLFSQQDASLCPRESVEKVRAFIASSRNLTEKLFCN